MSREPRKPRTKTVEDRRPHISRYDDVKALRSNNTFFYYPTGANSSADFPPQWEQYQAIQLIDFYAAVSCGTGTTLHKTMRSCWRTFAKVYEKQRGCCAVTGVRLIGGPSFGSNGIGIDLKSHSRKIDRYNLRLVSAPIAVTRSRYPVYREPIYCNIPPTIQKRNEILYLIFVELMKLFEQRNPFKHLPVATTVQYDKLAFYINLIDIHRDPSKEDYVKSALATYEFSTVFLRDDTIIVLAPALSYGLRYQYYSPVEKRIPLCEPGDFIEQMYTMITSNCSFRLRDIIRQSVFEQSRCLDS